MKLSITVSRKDLNNMSRLNGTWFRLRQIIFIVLLACVACSFATAQVTSGSIYGTVLDPSGAVIPGATVTIANPQIGLERKVTSGGDGIFVATTLPPATYTVTIEAKGFQKYVKQGVVLSAADRLNAGAFPLQVGSQDSAVTVTADSAELQLQTNSGERSDLISNKQLNSIALNGRMVLDYMKLVPGVISTFDGHQSATGGIDSFNINGTRANQHEFTIDGASNVDTGNNGGTHVTINPDAIAEVKVLTSNYQAEFGKAAGGQVVITTKSGTSDFHGNVRYFHRHESMNANGFFEKKPRYRYNYAGYQVGGPVLIPGTDFNKNRNKLFFFWSQEYYNQLMPVPDPVQFYTPTELERNGDFSQSRDGAGNPVRIAGPGVVNGNRIDRSLLSPTQQRIYDQVQTILKLYPLPNASGTDYNYSTTLSYDNPRREDIVRVDYQLNSSNRLFGRYIHNSDKTNSANILPWPGLGTFACAGAINLQGGCTSNHPGWSLSANLVSTITPTIVNEFSIGPSVTRTLTESNNGSLSRANNGVDMQLMFPVDGSQSIPDFSFGGVSGRNFGWSYLGGTPWYQANTTININDNLTWAKGAHTFKTGFFYQRSRKDQIAWENVNGEFSFDSAQSAPAGCDGTIYTCGHPYASALLGSFKSFDQSTTRPRGFFRYNQVEFFVQDTWKATRRLTLDYGMRFAWIPPQYDDKNQIAIFDPSTYNPANAVHVANDGSIDLSQGGNRFNGLLLAKDGQVPDGGWNSRGIMPQPRFGFAFDLFGTGKTVLRGGAGMMHDRMQGNLIFNTVFKNPTINLKPVVSNNNIANLPSLGEAAVNGYASPLKDIFGAERGGKVPTVYSYSLGVQQDIGAGVTLDVAYVGTLSRHLVTSRDVNAIPYGYAFTREAQDPSCFAGGVVPTVEPNLPAQYAAAGYSFTGQCARGRSAYTNAPLVPYQGYDQISYLKFDGTSNYNSLQVSVQRRFARGFTFGGVYTWSKALTTANSDEDKQDTFFPRDLGYRAASWDRTHVAAINYIFDLPKFSARMGGAKWLSYITDNYQISGVTQFMSGTPADLNDNWSFEAGAITGSNMWGAIPYYFVLDENENVIAPTIGVPARGSRDVLRNGGMMNWDMSLFKNIPLGERYSFQLRLEAFNVFNHTNFSDRHYGDQISVDGPWQWNSASTPITVSKGEHWGEYSKQYSGVGGPRVLQLGAKFYF